MAIDTSVPNELAQLCLVACDMSYAGRRAEPGQELAPHFDPLAIGPEYPVASSGFRVFRSFEDDSTGFKAVIYQKEVATQELIVAFSGTDGLHPTDWWSNVVHLGRNQWDQNVAEIFAAIGELSENYKIHFTGQSLGGALAQYAAYAFSEPRANIARSRVTLTTFNALGGLDGLKQGRAGYNPSVLAGIGLGRHYVVFNDLVSRLGSGMVGGGTYLLDYRDPSHLRPDGTRYALGMIDGHRIESGFYPHLSEVTNYFDFAIPHGLAQLNIPDLQRMAATFGNVLQRQSTNSVAAVIDLLAATWYAAVTTPNDQVRELTNALFEHANRSGDLSDSNTRILKAIPWGGTVKALTALAAVASPLVFAKTFVGSTFLRLVASGFGTPVSAAQQALQSEFGTTTTVQVGDAASMQDAAAQFKVLEARVNPQNAPVLWVVPVEGLAQTLTTSPDWQADTLDYVEETTDLSGTQRVELDANFGAAMHEAVLATPEITAEYADGFKQALRAHFEETGKEIANGNPDFVQDYSGIDSSVFGESIDIATYDAIHFTLDQAIHNPRNAGIKEYLELEQEIVTKAGQAIELRVFAAKPSNPFDGPSFDPHDTVYESDQLLDHDSGTYTLFLPYEATKGGQRIRVSLSGANAGQFRVTSHGQEITATGGEFYLTVPEGRKSVSFALAPTDDFDTTGTLAIDATLVDESGVATHREHREAELSLVDLTDFPIAKVFNAQAGTATLTGTQDPVTLASNDPRSFRTQLNGTTLGDVIIGDHTSEVINGGAGNDYIFEQQNSSGFHRAADEIRAGDGNDWVFGSLGYPGSLIDVGDGDNVVKASAGPQFLMRFVVGEGHPIFPAGLYTGTGPLGHFYSDFASALKVRDDGELPTVGTGGSLQLGVTYTLEGSGGGTSRVLHFVPLPGDTEAIFPETALDPGVVGGSSYTVEASGDGRSAILTYSGGTTPATYRVDITNAQDSQPPQNLGPLTIKAGSGNDRLFGASDEDFIQSGGGDDRIAGYGGDDTLLGGHGDDLVIAGAGDDYVDAGSGSNKAWGEAGNDALLGGSGNDFLVGDSDTTPLASQGNDYLDGGAGDDILAGNGGSDELFGGDGSDQLAGGAGNDYLDGENDNDVLVAGAGEDKLYGGSGDDQLDAAEGNDYLEGEAGEDVLAAGAGDDILYGGAGNDSLAGDSGNDLLSGDAGNDALVGGVGNDTLLGGIGNDMLDGGGGDDIYLMAVGSGMDAVHDALGSNVLQLGNVFDLRVAKAGAGDLVLTYGSGDAVTVQNGLAGSNFSYQVGGTSFGLRELLDQYADGPIALDGDEILVTGGGALPANMALLGGGQADTISAGGLSNVVLDGGAGNDTLIGGTGADFLYGGEGDDQLTGRAGDDWLQGDAGHDVYLFSADAGNDVVYDEGASTIAWDASIALSDLSAQLVTDGGGTALLVRYTTHDSVRLSGANLADHVFAFTDGTRLGAQDLMAGLLQSPVSVVAGDAGSTVLGGSFDDELMGSFGGDVLEGGAGNDFLAGGDSDDRYLFEAGDGVDVIADVSGASKVEFHEGISPEVIGARFLTNTDGSVTLEVQYTDADRIRISQTGSNLVDYSFWFADGTQWSMVNLMEAVLPGAVQLEGGETETALFGSRFDDILTSGTASERLLGGAGDDTYVYTLGGGVDSIRDFSGINTLAFGPGITLDMLALAPGSLRISIGDAGGAVHLETFDPDNPLAGADVENFRFADGSVLSLQELLAEGYTLKGTEDSDVIVGTTSRDTLIGLSGNDHLVGARLVPDGFNLGPRSSMWDEGNIYRGGPGEDVLAATAGSDVFEVNSGDGTDTVSDLHHDRLWFEFGGRIGGGESLYTSFFSSAEFHDPQATEPEHLAQLLTGRDTLRFGSGISSFDVVVTRELTPGPHVPSDDLVFTVAGTSDSIRFTDWFRAEINQLNRVEFANGRVWNLATINERLNGVPESENSAPVLANPAEDQTANEDAPFALEMPADTFADPEGDSLTYRITRSDGSPLPAWLVFDAQARTISGTPLQSDVGTIELRVTAADPVFEVSDDFTLSVLNVNDAPIVAVPLGPRSYATGTPFVFAIPAGTYTDEDGDALSMSAALFDGGQLPDWLAFDAASGTFNGNPQATDIGMSRVAVTATDAAGEFVAADFALIVRTADGTTARGGAGDDVIHGGEGDETLIARGGDDYLFGGQGNDLLRGGTGNDVLQGGSGADTLRGGAGQNVLDGGSGDDVIHGGVGSGFIAGGAGNDELRVGRGNDVIAFNSGDGIDTLYGGRDGGNTLSLGGGIGYDDLSLSKVGKDLVLNIGAVDRMVLKNWYSGNTSVLNLQLIYDAAAEFDATSSDPLFSKRVQTFDFMGLVSSFDAARTESPGVTSWALTNALLQWHLSHSDDAALGGDLAYTYGKNGGLGGISVEDAQQVIGAPGFGSDAQALRPFSGLQEGFAKLA